MPANVSNPQPKLVELDIRVSSQGAAELTIQPAQASKGASFTSTIASAAPAKAPAKQEEQKSVTDKIKAFSARAVKTITSAWNTFVAFARKLFSSITEYFTKKEDLSKLNNKELFQALEEEIKLKKEPTQKMVKILVELKAKNAIEESTFNEWTKLHDPMVAPERNIKKSAEQVEQDLGQLLMNARAAIKNIELEEANKKA